MSEKPEFSMNEFAVLDCPEILQIIFYPRRDSSPQPSVANATARLIPVGEGISISCRFYSADETSPNLLFFHGNGEIASDYDDVAPLFTQMGINFFVADYRGYGLSGGEPTLIDMIKDAHSIFDGFKQMLKQEGYSGNIFVMGRSMGSSSAIELAFNYQDQIKGVIIESGFASLIRILAYAGIPMEMFGHGEVKVSFNIERIQSVSIPTLIIHGERDELIPLQEGKDLYQNSIAEDKRLLVIPKATHNDIFVIGINEYLDTVKEFITAHS